MLCHIFKTGEQTDSNGNTKLWTISDLDKICYQFKNIHQNVPICIGHPKTNSPAYGWVQDVKRIGENLYCTFKGVTKDFENAVKLGMYKNRSISLDKDLNIRHIAFLGGQAPAVKGLEQFCFTDCDEYFMYEFQDKEEKMENLEQKLLEKEEEISKLKEQISQREKDDKLKAYRDFADSASQKGHILPKHKEYVVNILSAVEEADKFNFSDSESKSAIDAVKEFILSLQSINLNEVATPENKNEQNDLSTPQGIAKELTKIMKEKNVDLTTAFKTLNI